MSEIVISFDTRASELIEETENYKKHIAFLKKQYKFIEKNFGKYESDIDRNKWRITMKIELLESKIKSNTEKVYKLLGDPTSLLDVLKLKPVQNNLSNQ